MSDQETFNLGDAVAAKAPLRSRICPKSPKQAAVIATLYKQPTITLAEATELIGRNIYHNQQKHTGALLANMVKRGLIVRVKAGVFCLPEERKI